ncbi:MAG: M16 family metallopeptidase [Alloprevotella sp.]
MAHYTDILPNGLRLVCERTASDVVYCGYVVGAGTRHEDAADEGMAHFVEHLSFKGTERRSSAAVNNALERYGGDLNAYTNKQGTVYHATVLKAQFARAADLLTDIVFHSTFPQREIDKEVDVICDEIESFKDSPSELIFDEFEQRLFAGSPLGRDILGTAGCLKTYTTADALRFTRQHYRPENAVFFLSGDIEGKKAAQTLQRLFEKYPVDRPATPETAIAPALAAHRFDVSVNKDTHQAHVMIGAPTFGGSDGRRFALLLLNNMLGGPGMSSRLNIALRERAALVYSVDSYVSTYPDAGYWHVYFGCDGADVAHCCRLVQRELRRFAETPLTPGRLAAAKAQLCGQIGIAQDNGESRALALGRTYAEYGTVRDIALLRQNIEAVTAEDLRSLAAEIFAPERLCRLVYMPKAED